jgi:DNA-binding HxlR family transcriptional regulator
MHPESSEPPAADGSRLERAIILQLLRDDRDPKWSHEALRAELAIDEHSLEEALRALGEEGVVCLAEEQAWASRAARKLDELELIGI